QFEPGAVGFHIASLEMISLHDKLETGWCRGLLLDGIDATLGAVAEPYLQSFPRADEFFPLMLTGKLTMAEVYWKTTPMTSWMLCYVGDPLYTPYKADPQLKVQDLPPELQAIFKTAAPPPPRPVPAPSVTGPTLPPPPDRPGI
ncbi:MAG TPA: TIGR03790 family protein, partial [Tepidisphaeraceae bacterium]|nr:TIGR03790 family protein [Tepidisphaeraceae bacterium]